MKQELRFWLDLGRLALLKNKIWANYEQLFMPVFKDKKKIKTYAFFFKFYRRQETFSIVDPFGP